MSFDLGKYQEALDCQQRWSRDKARAEGVQAQILKQLKEEFDCQSRKEAEKLEVEIKRKLSEMDQEWDQAYQKFQEQFGDLLNKKD